MENRKGEREQAIDPALLRRMLMPVLQYGMSQLQAGARPDHLLTEVSMISWLAGQGMEAGQAIRLIRRMETRWEGAPGREAGGKGPEGSKAPTGQMPWPMMPWGQMPSNMMPWGQMPSPMMPWSMPMGMPWGRPFGAPFGQMGPNQWSADPAAGAAAFPMGPVPLPAWGGHPYMVQGAQHEGDDDATSAET